MFILTGSPLLNAVPVFILGVVGFIIVITMMIWLILQGMHFMNISFSSWKQFARRCNKGYSLLEIMLGMAIVATILVGIIQLARTINDRMKVESTKTILRTMKAGVDQYKTDLGHYPQKVDELMNPPSDQNDRRRWQGPYAPAEYARDGVIKDSYGNEIEYRFDAAKQSFELFSWGKNGQGSDVGNIFVD